MFRVFLVEGAILSEVEKIGKKEKSVSEQDLKFLSLCVFCKSVKYSSFACVASSVVFGASIT